MIGVPLTYVAGGTITKYAACVTNAEGTVVVGANDNDANFVGFAQHAAVSGEAVRLSRDGDVTKAVVGTATIAIGDYLTTGGAAGAVITKGTTAATAYHVICQALEVGDTAGDEIAVIQRPFYDRNIA
jgi:hypothetical protein